MQEEHRPLNQQKPNSWQNFSFCGRLDFSQQIRAITWANTAFGGYFYCGIYNSCCSTCWFVFPPAALPAHPTSGSGEVRGPLCRTGCPSQPRVFCRCCSCWMTFSLLPHTREAPRESSNAQVPPQVFSPGNSLFRVTAQKN